MNRWKIFLVAGLLLVLDALSKMATVKYLPPMFLSPATYPYGGIGIFENFLGIECSLSYTTNTGAAWGVFSDWQTYLLAFRVLLILAISVYVALYVKSWKVQLPFALLLTGAVGNVIDFFAYGFVVDMLHFVLWGYDFPVFNLADSYITIGVGILFALSFLGDWDAAEADSNAVR